MNERRVRKVSLWFYIWFSIFMWLLYPKTSLLGVIIGAVIPDCDKRNSGYWKYFPFHLIFKENRFTHSLLALYLIGTLSYFLTFDSFLALGVAFGYGVHLLLDLIMGQKCQLLYPIKEMYSLKNVTFTVGELLLKPVKKIFIKFRGIQS